MSTGDELPHSLEAEENLLSCCTLDGSDTVARCSAAGVKASSFFEHKHGTIYTVLLGLYEKRQAIDCGTLAEELKASGQLEAIGGISFLAKVTERVPTTASVQYFIDTVQAYAMRRALIVAALGIIADAKRPDSDVQRSAETRIRAALSGGRAKAGEAMHWPALLAFSSKEDCDCLMGNRFLGRAGGCVIVAPSGVGKSVLALQLGACAALARPFFGVRMQAPMRVLLVQAEDDLGDVAEAAQGFVQGYGIEPDELAALNERFRIVRWTDCAGGPFLQRLSFEHSKWPFDLVIINPLFSFCGCNVSEQAEMSQFLRNGLNPILNDTRAAAILVHHTNKPPTKNGKGADLDEELRYSGSGSAELTNWARAYLTLKGVASAGPGVYKLTFAKRGNRAGIVDEYGNTATSIYIEHATHGLCWVPSDYRPDQGGMTKFKVKFDLHRAQTIYNSALSWTENEQAIALDQNISRKTVSRWRHQLLDTAA